MTWLRTLACSTGIVDQDLLLRNEYLAAENGIMKSQLKARLRLTDAERITLAEIAHRLGRKALKDVANIAKPDTILTPVRLPGSTSYFSNDIFGSAITRK